MLMATVVEFIKRVGEKGDKMRGLPSFYAFFATRSIYSIMQVHGKIIIFI